MDKHSSDSAAITVLRRSPSSFFLQMQDEQQYPDVGWRGQSLLQGTAQLGTIVPSG